MKGISSLSAICILVALLFLVACKAGASDFWTAPFDTASAGYEKVDSTLSLSDVLKLAAAGNPTLKSLGFDRLAAEALLEQAGLWSNPELELEVEEVGWDAPGFRESEITISIAQEFELFGLRGARKRLAREEIQAVEFLTKTSAFDFYIEVKRRFYTLSHAQQNLRLSQESAKLARDIVENINFRIEKGAGLQSELLLAELEEQRARVKLEQYRQEMYAAEKSLVALWSGQANGIQVTEISDPEFELLKQRVGLLENAIDSTRAVMNLKLQSAILHAEKSLAAAEARPGITISSAYKRFEADNSNTFSLGVAMPLPFLNRNQGILKNLEARLRSLTYRIDRERLDAVAGIQSNSIRLHQLIYSHDILDSLLLPTAQKAYETLQQAYESGRVPFTQLLEAGRSLNELRLEHNDLLLSICKQIIEIESLTGFIIRIDKEN